MFKDKRFSPSLFASILTLVVALSMLRLGLWQYDRAQEKVALQSSFDEKLSAPQLMFDEKVIMDLTNNRYQSVSMEGRYIDRFQFILDNQPRGLISGYDVITPFLTERGVVLVNRGWVERNIDRSVLPETRISEQPRIIQGKINLPGKAFGLGQMTFEDGWPRRVQFVDYRGMADLLNAEGIEESLLPFVLMLDAVEPDGFQRDWKPLPQGPEKHYAYMVQWFAMAFTVCVIYFILGFKKREKDGDFHE